MKSIFFTKPKAVTLQCVQFLVEQKEELLGVVLYEKARYEDSPFMQYCREHGVPVYDFTELERLYAQHGHELEMIYCKTFPKKIPSYLIDAAKIAAINFHSAPLPEYKGVFGYNFAFLNHETEYGVTCHFLSDAFDDGGIIEVLRFPYDFDHGSVPELVALCDKYVLALFEKVYFKFLRREPVEGYCAEGGTYYSRAEFEARKKIDLHEPPAVTRTKVRAFWCPPYGGAYLEIGGEKYYVLSQEQYEQIVKGDAK